MENWLAWMIVVVVVAAFDRALRKHFRQEGDRTFGARQRDPQADWKRPTGDVIEEMTRRTAPKDHRDE